MKVKYSIPEMEILEFRYESVITDSNGDMYIDDTITNPDDEVKTEGWG